MASLQEKLAYHGVLLSVISKDGTRCLANFFESRVSLMHDTELRARPSRQKLLKDFISPADLLGNKAGTPNWTNEERDFLSGTALSYLSLNDLEFPIIYKLVTHFCGTRKGNIDPSWWESKKTVDTTSHGDVLRLQRAYQELYDAPDTCMSVGQFDERYLALVDVFHRMMPSLDKNRHKSIYDRCMILNSMASYLKLLQDIGSSFESLEALVWEDNEVEAADGTFDDTDEGHVLQVLTEDVTDGMVHSTIKVDVQHMMYPQDAHKLALPRLGRLRRVGVLGSGAFGKVRLYKDEKSGLLVAVKKDGSKYNKSKRRALLNEISLMRNLSHERIVMYYGAVEAHMKVYLLMEYVPKGSVSDELKRSGAVDEMTVRKYVRQMLEGLQYLHMQHVIHRDIKGSNILLTDDNNIKLTDFGLSWQLRSSADTTRGRAGTLCYMAPEVLRGMSYGTKADVWSVGCTVVEMLTTRPPWAHVHDSGDLAYRIANHPPSYQLPHGAASPLLRAFLYKIFMLKPHFRPTASELLQDEVLNE